MASRALPRRGAAQAPSHAAQPQRRVAARALCVRVQAARQGRGGRFPTTPHVEGHALAAACGGDASAAAAACDAWRGGRSGADVLATWLALPPRGDAGATPDDAAVADEGRGDGGGAGGADCRDGGAASSPQPSVLTAAAFPAARLLLTSLQPALEAAIALEAHCASPGALPLGLGLFAAPSPAPPPRLRRMLSLRAEIDPLAAAGTAAGLVHAVAALRWHAAGERPDTASAAAAAAAASAPWKLHHERRGAAAERLPSPELVCAVRAAMRPADAGDGGAPTDDSALQPLRFTVVETERGYVFGLVTCAPQGSPATASAWAAKPHNYCAGLPLPLATLAVNLVTGLEPQGKAVVDPCCGSGTVPFAAACLGAGAAGGVEREAALVTQARANLAALAPTAAAARAQLAAAALQRAPGAPTCVGSDADAALSADVARFTPPLLCANSTRVAFACAPGDAQPGAAATLQLRLRVLPDDAAETSAAESAALLLPLGEGLRRVDAFVTNLPYGRVVSVGQKRPGGGVGEAMPDEASVLDDVAPLLAWLRPQAARHAFFAGAPVAPLLHRLGYADVVELCVDDTGRRFLALASAGDHSTIALANRCVA